jgi:hypothetical protein
MFNHFAIINESASALFRGWIIYPGIFLRKPKPALVVGHGRILKLILIMMTCGLIAGCANPDPLAVASGPVFALNSGHWQPAPQDLAAPPVVTDK